MLKTLERFEFPFAIILITPLVGCLFVLISTIRPPHELFSDSSKLTVKKKKTIARVVEAKKEEATPLPSLTSLSTTLEQPSQNSGALSQLSAGLVSEATNGAGGLQVSQGDVNAQQIVNDSASQSKLAQVLQVSPPVYPQTAQSRGISGYVIVELVISETGKVTAAKVLSANPVGIFDTAALDAIYKWKFSPAVENGKNVVSRLKQKVNFELD